MLRVKVEGILGLSHSLTMGFSPLVHHFNIVGVSAGCTIASDGEGEAHEQPGARDPGRTSCNLGGIHQKTSAKNGVFTSKKIHRLT